MSASNAMSGVQPEGLVAEMAEAGIVLQLLLHRQRPAIDAFAHIGVMKQYRVIATRYEKHAELSRARQTRRHPNLAALL